MLSDEFLNSHVTALQEMTKTSKILQDFDPLLKVVTLNPEIFRRFPLGLYYLLFPTEIEKELAPLQQLASEKEGMVSELGDMFAEQILAKGGVQELERIADETIKRAKMFKQKLAKFKKKKGEDHADNP
jgi:hypothetical protein